MSLIRIMLLTSSCALGAIALAGATSPFPAWQLVPVEPGRHQPVRFIPAVPLDLTNPPRLSVPGAEITSLGFSEESGEITFTIAGEPGDSFSFDSVMLDYGSGPEPLRIGPVQVLWLNPPQQMPLLIGARLSFRPSGSVMEARLENHSEDTIELTGFHYAPEGVATGRLQLAKSSGQGDRLFELQVPGVEYGAPPPPVLPDNDTLPLEPFSFSERSVVMEPGAQVLLVLTGDGFTDPELFDSRHIFEFAPVYEYRSGGITHNFTFVRHYYEWEPDR